MDDEKLEKIIVEAVKEVLAQEEDEMPVVCGDCNWIGDPTDLKDGACCPACGSKNITVE